MTRQVALLKQQLKQQQDLANQRRQQEAERQAQHASREADQAHPAALKVVERNAELAAIRKSVAERIAEIDRQKEKVDQELANVTAQYTGIQEKVKVAGATNASNAIGLLLRKQREKLPNLREHSRNLEMRRQTSDTVQYEWQDVQDERKDLANLDEATLKELRKMRLTSSSGNPAELQAAVHEALKTKRDFLDALCSDYNSYYDKLINLNTAERSLIKKTEECGQFIDERVLWIASATPLGMNDLRYASEAFWSLANASWGIGQTLAADVVRTPAVTALALGVFLALLCWRTRLRTRLREIGERAARENCCRFPLTVETAVLIVLIASLWPGVMWYVGWRLTAAADATDWFRAVGEGFAATARAFLAVELLWHACCPLGLCQSHFDWPTAALKQIRQNIRWFGPPALVLMCGAVAMAWQDNDHWDASLGRLYFMAALLIFSLALHQIFRPKGAVFQAIIAPRRGGWLDRFRYLWYPLCALTPAALAVLAGFGYHYTARQLTTRVILTAYVLVGGVVCRALLLRWATVNQHKLAIEQSRTRRADPPAENHAGEEAAEPAAESDRDIATINIQTRRLIEYSLAVASVLVIWCAWIDVPPALSSINYRMPWTGTVVVATEVPLRNGGKMLQFDEQVCDIKLADLLLAVIVLATTIIAAKNIPGVLEIAVLQHMPFDAGARYAVATVSRYVITVVGLLFCFGIMGVGWSKVQWLFAAMGLGLGFGLQEIFANFISGLIILFERPVRVGDVVTIDAITGTVSRIRIRATTITDADRKELIIPNKEFITGRVLNWTLTDPINRVVIKVDVAYGTDTELVARLLRKLAEDHPDVLADPPPNVALESFGDSCAELCSAMLPAQFGKTGNRHQRVAHGHRSGVPRSRHRNAVSAT